MIKFDLLTFKDNLFSLNHLEMFSKSVVPTEYQGEVSLYNGITYNHTTGEAATDGAASMKQINTVSHCKQLPDLTRSSCGLR